VVSAASSGTMFANDLIGYMLHRGIELVVAQATAADRRDGDEQYRRPGHLVSEHGASPTL